MSKYEKEIDKEREKAIKEWLDKMTPEERAEFKKSMDGIDREEMKKLIANIEESAADLVDSMADVNVFGFGLTKIVGIGDIGQRVVGLLADGYSKPEYLITINPDLSEEAEKNLMWSATVLIIAGPDVDAEKIESLAKKLKKDDDVERFVLAVVTSAPGRRMAYADATIYVPETYVVTIREVICDLLTLVNFADLVQDENGGIAFKKIGEDMLKYRLSIAVSAQSVRGEDERAEDAANAVVQKLFDNDLQMDKYKRILCVTGGRDFNGIEEWETMEIDDIIHKVSGKKIAFHCSRRENGMDGKLRATVVVVPEI